MDTQQKGTDSRWYQHQLDLRKNGGGWEYLQMISANQRVTSLSDLYYESFLKNDVVDTLNALGRIGWQVIQVLPDAHPNAPVTWLMGRRLHKVVTIPSLPQRLLSAVWRAVFGGHQVQY